MDVARDELEERADVRVRPCILIPTYDNVGTIAGVVEAALGVGLAVLVVNDGASDGTAELLRATPGITLLEHARNRGKGAALRTGFEAAWRAGFTHAVTLDSDGQHDPEWVPRFVAAAREDPLRLVLGNRDLAAAGAGRGSIWGRRNSNFWTWVETGLRLPDTQTGFRCYPLEALRARHFVRSGFDFELEVIVKLAWSGVPVHSIPIPVRYFTGGERVSHMKPLRDFLRIARMNTSLAAARICFPPPYLELATRSQFMALPRLERVRASFRELFVREPGSSGRIAVSAGVGFFIGLSPIWGYQILLTLLASHKLRLSKTVALLSAHVSLPPFIPIIVYASLVIGRVLLGEEGGPAPTSLDVAPRDLPAWVLGSFSLAAAAGLVGGTLVYLLVSSARRLRGRATA
jgi:glycosyltransferase involved in cell wall biosynthesis